jgi:hypothetical protein
MLWAVVTVLWLPLIGGAGAALHGAAAALPPAWSRRRRLAVLAPLGASAFVLAGVARALVITRTGHDPSAPWPVQWAWALRPLTILGLGAGACLAWAGTRAGGRGAGGSPAGRASTSVGPADA